MADITEREHKIGLIDEIVCRGGGTVQLVSGPDPHLVVVGPEEFVNRVVIRYRGMRLVIAYRVGPNPVHLTQRLSDRVRTIVVTDAVSRVAVQGAATLQLGESPERPFTTDSIKLVSSGNGFITGSVSVGTIAVRLRSVGGAELIGDAGYGAIFILIALLFRRKIKSLTGKPVTFEINQFAQTDGKRRLRNAS